jgi:hypothetical protein
MTTYAADINQTEGPVANGCIVTAKVGSGGVTAGQSVKLSSGTAVVCTAKTDVFYGAALDTGAENAYVRVARTGCRVKTSATLTSGAYIQPKDGGSGEWEDFTDGIKAAICEVAATGASVIRIL